MAGANHPKRKVTLALAVATIGLAGCDPAGFLANNRVPETVAQVEPAADASGVITYENFRVIVARDGDTIQSLASRVSLDDVVLARYNGLPTNYLLRPGERLALPDSAQVAAVNDGWTPEVVTGVLDDLPDDAQASASLGDAPGTQLTRHKVERGETAFSIARLYGVSVTALSSWNGLNGDLEVTPGRSLIIPPNEARTRVITDETETSALNDPGETTAVPPPPSSEQPLPEDVAAPTPIPDGPDLGEPETDTRIVSTGKFHPPVSGTVVKPYSKEPGRNKNEGLDYETAANASVKSAAAGEVALVSRSLGGLGTIVLVRHRDDIMTVYGRVKDVTVQKGDKVSKGQTIGKVADASPPIFHFEVRRGTQSIDPAPFL
jgi:murein DD-endopeptidase MepM/ murein hydrolase activator NlpD